ncbi:peptidoglycan editing factor PgeF [Hyphomicrobium sp.]|uniref:peptidoglycan editing factor PgeF n=1 Tax=Hyphomicrobium sp. TaxID=82 RepID=UPI002D77BE86|nr:peptidoglycan editing factor PgeF [Hyphomicrobium sp.]HET6390128.1 peptidoglycan editing factor PgeF [Hyphomicrobium sp.]
MTLKPVEAKNLHALAGIKHGFFTRQGGVSTGIYESLNCGLGSNDDQTLVLENRRRIGLHLGRDEATFGPGVITLYQEHGTTAFEVTEAPSRDALPHADAVVSKTPGLVIGILTADCAPVLLADAEAGVAAAAHAGWRGALHGIIESAIREMERLGARRERISAAVGPCIGQAAYEVGPDFEAAFVSRDPAYARHFKQNSKSGRPHFDLPGFVMSRLAAAGVSNTENLALCTYENESLFFSYRRKTHRGDTDYGRQISAIVVA